MATFVSTRRLIERADPYARGHAHCTVTTFDERIYGRGDGQASVRFKTTALAQPIANAEQRFIIVDATAGMLARDRPRLLLTLRNVLIPIEGADESAEALI